MTALRKVLVVDDDPVVAKSFERVLSSKGYAVITAANGEEALRKLKDEKYDVVYTDIRMPGMNGLEVAERVKAQQPWTPVVIITGYGTDAAEARAKSAGVSSFLHKPLSPEMIEGSARDALAEPATEAEVAVSPVPAEEAAPAGSALKNIALFLASPFIALAYVIALPFVGLGMIAVLAVRAASKKISLKTVGVALKNTGLFLIAPLCGVAYAVTFAIVATAMIMWLAGKAVLAPIKR